MILNIKGVPVKTEVIYSSSVARTYHICFGEISARITKGYGLNKLEKSLNNVMSYEMVSKFENEPFIDGDYAYILGNIERVYPKKYTNAIDDIYLLVDRKKVSCRKFFLDVITSRVRYYEKIMNLPEHQVKIKHLTAILGNNNCSKKVLTFNEKLVHFDISLIDEVVVHELCHDFYRNHSKSFYDKVSEFCFDYKEKKDKLIYGVRR